MVGPAAATAATAGWWLPTGMRAVACCVGFMLRRITANAARTKAPAQGFGTSYVARVDQQQIVA
jgi:hypothetical protein